MSFSDVLAQGSTVGGWTLVIDLSIIFVWVLFRFAIRSAVQPKFAEVNTRLTSIDKRFEQMDQRFERLEQKIDS